jgi:hypothetical protein
MRSWANDAPVGAGECGALIVFDNLAESIRSGEPLRAFPNIPRNQLKKTAGWLRFSARAMIVVRPRSLIGFLPREV